MKESERDIDNKRLIACVTFPFLVGGGCCVVASCGAIYIVGQEIGEVYYAVTEVGVPPEWLSAYGSQARALEDFVDGRVHETFDFIRAEIDFTSPRAGTGNFITNLVEIERGFGENGEPVFNSEIVVGGVRYSYPDRNPRELVNEVWANASRFMVNQAGVLMEGAIIEEDVTHLVNLSKQVLNGRGNINFEDLVLHDSSIQCRTVETVSSEQAACHFYLSFTRPEEDQTWMEVYIEDTRMRVYGHDFNIPNLQTDSDIQQIIGDLLDEYRP